MKNTLKIIDKLQTETAPYYIDFLPQRVESTRYFDLEEYFLEKYLFNYSAKISKIIIELISYYNTEIYLTEFPNTQENVQYKELCYKNIRNMSFTEIDKIIRLVIEKDLSSVQVYFTDYQFVISINGEFSVDIYGAENEQLSLISQLVNQENLYLKKSD